MSDGFTGLDVEAARRHLTRLLRQHAIETPELDARLLVGAVMQLDLTGLVTAAARLLSARESTEITAFAQRRIAGEPVARIVGSQEFWGLRLRLSATTLVPRPDTETLVEAALQSVQADHRAAPRRIADIGTGSGALLLAMLSEWPAAFGVGCDIDEGTLHTAAQNARCLGLSDRSAFVQCNYAEALGGNFDIIVSNPPYIPSVDIDGLDIEVREHDPRLALDGGADGLDAYRALVPQAASRLAPGGWLLLEVGLGQSHAVRQMIQSSGLTVSSVWPDLLGVPRVVGGQNGFPQGSPGQ